MAYNFILFLFLNLLEIIYPQNKFSIQLVEEKQRNGTYIRPVVSENGYLYLVTGEDDETNVKRHRYIVVYDTNTASFVKTLTYESDFGFWRGEPYLIGDNSQYLFITTYLEPLDAEFYSSYEFLRISDQKTTQRVDYSVHGYRRTFKKIGSYYYHMYLNQNKELGYWYLEISKMRIINKNNFISFETINTSKEAKIKYQAMISCDVTKDNNYILCAYHSQELNIVVTVYDTSLNLLLSKSFEKTGYYDSGNLIKLLYLKDNANFILINSQYDTVIRLRYFSYVNNQIKDKLCPITKKFRNLFRYI